MVQVDDENDNAPHIGNASVNVSAAESVDSVFYELRAEDADLPAGAGPFTYAIDAGNERSLFKVAAATGQLAYARRVETSDFGYHTLAMHVSDGRHRTPFTVLVNVDPRLAPSLHLQRLAGGAAGAGDGSAAAAAGGSSMSGSGHPPTVLELILLIAALVSLMLILVLVLICVALLLTRRRGGCCGRRGNKRKLRGVGGGGGRRSDSLQPDGSPPGSPDDDAMQQIVLVNRQGLLYAPVPPADGEAALHSTTNSSNVTGATLAANATSVISMLQVASPTSSQHTPSRAGGLSSNSKARLASLTKLQMPPQAGGGGGARGFAANLVVDEGIHTPGSMSGGSSVSSHRNDLNLNTIQRVRTVLYCALGYNCCHYTQ